jgi:hypothetical protein
LVSGAITYVKEPTASVADDEVLICCAVPAKPEGAGDNRILLPL